MPFGISFTNPWALLLFLPLAAYFAWLAQHSLADLSQLRRRLAIFARLTILTLLVLALAGTQVVIFNRHLATIFVLDYSDSVSPRARERGLDYIRRAVGQKRDGDEAGIVVFGSEAYIELSPTVARKIGAIQTVVPSQFTDISAAIRLGMASLPQDMQKHLVVLSDGNENLGNALDEAQAASNSDVKIDVVPLGSPARHEVMLERLTLPGEAKIGEPIDVKVVALSTDPVNAQIKLFSNDRLLGHRDVHLTAGKSVFTFPQTITQAGATTFEAQIETKKTDDTLAENNRALGFVNIRGLPHVLLVSDQPTQARFLLDALQKEKVNAQLSGPNGLPSELRQMEPYDAIILDNVPAWELSSRQMLSLQSYVRDLGCGLVMVGGDSSFGPGGYRSTPVEETLPVSMDIKQMQYLPGGAVAMVMHSCEFPAGNDWAKAVCSQVTRQLGDQDYAGLIVFGMDVSWVYKGGMLRVGPNRNYMMTQIRGIDPGDMPDFDATLELAYSGLMKTHAYLKHCIILSDGDPSPPTPELVKKFNDARITVSTVVIKPHDASGTRNMWTIAHENGGRFYAVDNPAQIPNIFLKEAATVSRSAIIEEPFVPRQSAESTILKGVTKAPPLLGYVGTTSKPTATEILKSNQDDPVLATWQYGLGKSVAFTSDASQRWAAGWLPWSGFSKFWAQAVRWSMRGATSGDLQANVTLDKGKGTVKVEAIDKDGNFINFLNPLARLISPDLKGSDLNLEQTGPGQYEASFDARQLGTYLINLRTDKNGHPVSQLTGGVLPYSPEYGAIGTNNFLLSQIAARSGGDLLSLGQPESVFGRPRRVAGQPNDIWLLLLMITACLFPLDVAVRRLMWGEEELTELSKKLPRPRIPFPARKSAPKHSQQQGPPPGSVENSLPPMHAPGIQEATEEEPASSLERLRAAKRRARKPDK